MAPAEPAAALLAVRELNSTLEALLDAVAGRYGINRTDLRCLEILEREGVMNARDLARHAGLSPAAVTKVLDRLVGSGYVVRRTDSADRRAQVLSTSDEHAELRASVWRPVEDAVRRTLEAVPEETLGEFTELLRRVAALNREQAARLSGPPTP